MQRSLPKKTSCAAHKKASASPWSTSHQRHCALRSVRSEGLFLDCNVSDGKKFLRCKIICTAKRRHYGSVCVFTSPQFERATFPESKVVEERLEETLEVALRDADVVAWKNQNGCIESVDLFDAGTRSPQKDLVLVGQGSAAPRCGVDVDPVPLDVRMRHRCMAMNDKFSVVRRRVQKFMTNPEQIMEVLLLDRNARANAGMDEQEVSAAKTVTETLQEQLVCTRKGTPKATMRIDFDLGLRPARTDAVGCKGLHAGQLQPGTEVGRIPEKVLHQAFVISAQAHRASFHH